MQLEANSIEFWLTHPQFIKLTQISIEFKSLEIAIVRLVISPNYGVNTLFNEEDKNP